MTTQVRSDEVFEEFLSMLRTQSPDREFKGAVVETTATAISTIVRILIDDGSEERYFYLKTPLNPNDTDSARIEAHRTEQFSKTLEGHPNYFSVALAGHLPRTRSLAVEQVAGKNLGDQIELLKSNNHTQERLDTLDIVRMAGEFLSVVASRSTISKPTKEVQDFLQGEFQSLFRHLYVLTSKKNADALVMRVSNVVEYAFSNFDKLDCCLAHGDYHPGNILLTDGEQMGVIDLRDSEVLPSGYDAIYFEHQLRQSKSFLRGPKVQTNRLISAFWNGYGVSKLNIPLADVIEIWFHLRSVRYMATLIHEQSFLRKLVWRVDAVRTISKLKNLTK